MKTQLFAVFNKRGFTRATKRPVGTDAREIGVMIDVEIPDAAFDDGFLHASIAVPENAFVLPDVEVVVRPREHVPAEQEGDEQ